MSPAQRSARSADIIERPAHAAGRPLGESGLDGLRGVQRALVGGEGDVASWWGEADLEQFAAGGGVERDGFAGAGPEAGQRAEAVPVAGEGAGRGEQQGGPLV